MLLAATMSTVLGPMTAGVRVDGGESLCALSFGAQLHERTMRDLAARLGCDWSEGTPALMDELCRQLDAFAARQLTVFDIPLSMPGTSFQRDVWAALREIPYGTTVTYATLAGRIGRPSAHRAVGCANGRNRIPIIVPCHRVVASSGLGGYAGGLSLKRQLLAIESTACLSGGLFGDLA